MQRYIDLGWHTVPLAGQLRRLEDGSKTIPIFEKDWRQKYQAEFNSRVTAIGGAVTGQCSNIIAIDCDNTATFMLFSNLDPDYQVLMHSVGKGAEICGTFIYTYDEELCDSFSVQNNILALDVYSNNGFIYLATEANETKTIPQSLDIRPMPDTVKVLLKQLHLQQNKRVDNNHALPTSHSCLAPLVSQFVQTRKYMPGLFKIITPRDFRDLEQYQRVGHLHPELIPEGRGSEYLVKVSAILGADISIDKELYVNAMHQLNSLFETPMPSKRLDATILDPMIDEKSSVNGTSIWQYDENWEQQRIILQTKRQASLEVVYDDNRLQYYAVDLANEQVKNFSKDTDFWSYLEATALALPKKGDVKRGMPLVNVTCDPSQPFGFIPSEDFIRTFNNFVPTPALRVMHNPEQFADKYIRPETTLKFFESLVPDVEMRNYLLRFLKHKFLTFDYSPVMLYFLGVHGSGKDTFVTLLEKIIGKVTKPTVREFLEPFNGWMLDTYFVQLDEYGNQLTKQGDRDEALGILKAYTGKATINIRVMRTDGYSYNHHVTFISTANKNALVLEDGDRRIAYFNTPNVLAEQDWVVAMGGISVAYNRIMSEVVDFCYYLATEVEDMSGSEYVMPPATDSKHELIANSMGIAQKLAYACKHQQLDLLRDLAEEAGVRSLQEELADYEATTHSLQLVYDELTNFEGDKRAMVKAIKNMNVPTFRSTTKQNQHTFRIRFTAPPKFVEEEGDFV